MSRHEADKVIHVVDDERLIREILLEILSAYGFQTRTFSSAENYLTYMQKNSFGTPTILLSDINMPGMDGFQLLREVQQRYPDVCCMLMTGNPGQCAEEHLRQYGLVGRVHHVFMKPFSLALLMEVLQSI